MHIDLITAIPGAINTFGAAMGVWFGICRIRDRMLAKLPIAEIETRPDTLIGSNPVWRCSMRIKNKLNETLTVSDIKVIRPKNALISTDSHELQAGIQLTRFGEVRPTEFTKTPVFSKIKLEEAGAAWGDPSGRPYRTSEKTEVFYIQLPAGEELPSPIKVRLSLNSARSLRNRRIVVRG